MKIGKLKVVCVRIWRSLVENEKRWKTWEGFCLLAGKRGECIRLLQGRGKRNDLEERGGNWWSKAVKKARRHGIEVPFGGPRFLKEEGTFSMEPDGRKRWMEKLPTCLETLAEALWSQMQHLQDEPFHLAPRFAGL